MIETENLSVLMCIFLTNLDVTLGKAETPYFAILKIYPTV